MFIPCKEGISALTELSKETQVLSRRLPHTAVVALGQLYILEHASCTKLLINFSRNNLSWKLPPQAVEFKVRSKQELHESRYKFSAI